MAEVTNKSQFVRDVLKQIGALKVNPPEGWVDKVKKALSDNKLSMHDVTIYALRRKQMQSGGAPPGKPGRKPGKKIAKAQAAPAEPQVEAAPSNGAALAVNDLVQARKIAEQFGGIERLSSALTGLRELGLK